MKTRQERRNSTIRLVIIGILILVIATLFFDTPLRSRALDALQIVENLKNVTGPLSVVATVIVVILLLVENAEKFHFIWEMAHKLLGYDLEEMAQNEREYTDLPADYISRPEFEHMLQANLQPGKAPKLILFTGATDAGKTTMLKYALPHGLNRRYKGQVVSCRGDLESIEREPGESETQARRRLVRRILQRVVKKVDVPGDVGESLREMRQAIKRAFEEEQRSQLIIIDQIDDPGFLYAEVLPCLYGRNNTVVVVGPHIAVDETARCPLDEDEPITVVPLTITPFTGDEAFEMFRHEVRKRKGALQSQDTEKLKNLLTGTWPGTVQHLSDIYVSSGGMASLQQARGLQGDRDQQDLVVAETLRQSLTDPQQRFVAALSLVVGDTVSMSVLQMLAKQLCQGASVEELVQLATTRRYLRADEHRQRGDRDQRYVITKLGHMVGDALMTKLGRQVELATGAVILDAYRDAQTSATPLNLNQALPNILGIVGWAEQRSHVLETDLLSFIHLLRTAFYTSGRWEVGMKWLEHTTSLAHARRLYRTECDLWLAQVRILLAQGCAVSALTTIQQAREANDHSISETQGDLSLGTFVPARLNAALYYDHLQRHWMTHLAVTAYRLQMDARQSHHSHERLRQDVAEALAWLRTPPSVALDATTQKLAQAIQTALQTDEGNLWIAQGDADLADGHAERARTAWRQAQRSLAIADTWAQHHQDQEAIAQIERAYVKLHRRAIQADSGRLARFGERRQGQRHAIRSLDASRRTEETFEEALTYLENAQLALAGLPASSLRQPGPEDQKRRLVTVFSWRWRRLNSARKQLLIANATAATLGAQAHQFLLLHVLIDVTMHLYAIDHDPQHGTVAREYLASATAIAQRLRQELPNLQDSLTHFPAWLQPPQIAPEPAELLGAPTRKRGAGR